MLAPLLLRQGWGSCGISVQQHCADTAGGWQHHILGMAGGKEANVNRDKKSKRRPAYNGLATEDFNQLTNW